jgi:hypothetical protein
MNTRRTFIKTSAIGLASISVPNYILGKKSQEVGYKFEKSGFTDIKFPKILIPIFETSFEQFKKLNYTYSANTVLYSALLGVAVVPITLKAGFNLIDHQILIFNFKNEVWNYLTSFNKFEIESMEQLSNNLAIKTDHYHPWIPNEIEIKDGVAIYKNDNLSFIPSIKIEGDVFTSCIELKNGLDNFKTFVFKNKI